MSNSPQISFRFIRMGSRAPDPVPSCELWLDVGNRVSENVIDHHGGNTEAWNASQLFMQEHDKLVSASLPEQPQVTFVLHESPDADAVLAAWLAKNVLTAAGPVLWNSGIRQIVDEISYNDQGYLRVSDPESSWILVFRTYLDAECDQDTHLERVIAGWRALDITENLLNQGKSLADVAQELITPAIRIVLARAKRDYAEDLSRAALFQVRLPIYGIQRVPMTVIDEPSQCPPRTPSTGWSLVDGLVIEDPRCELFRELARGDNLHSPLGQGFALLVVVTSVHLKSSCETLKRFRISTDPMSGLHLRGLGTLLEHREQAKEKKLGLSLPPERVDLPAHTGRWHWNVESPWYDGRGHLFTIVDSPSVLYDGEPICRSTLETAEVLETVWEYGNPATFIGIRDSELSIMYSAQLEDSFRHYWTEEIELEETCPQLSSQVLRTLSTCTDEYSLKIFRRTELKTTANSGIWLYEQQVWHLSNDIAIWVGRFRMKDNQLGSDTADLISQITKQKLDSILHPGVKLDHALTNFHIAMLHMSPAHAVLDNSHGYFSQFLDQIVRANPTRFTTRNCHQDRDLFYVVPSTDHQLLMRIGAHGMVLVSTHDRRLEHENDITNPTCINVVVSLAMLQKEIVRRLAISLASHRAERNTMRATRLVLKDRLRLMHANQFLFFGELTDDSWGQSLYDAIRKVIRTEESLTDLRRKVDELSHDIKEVRASFYQRIAFWLSVIFAPLSVTAGIFGGAHMNRDYGDHFVTIWGIGGWLLFLAVFVLLAIATLVTWITIGFIHRRHNVIKQLRSPQN
jgi:hypothetical protein